jgi:mannose-6-phosphate isomerase-like protein (cupin superfamily)
MENRRQLFAMLGAALAAAGAPSANAKVTDNVLGSDKAQKLEHPFGVQHIYYQGPTDMLQVFEGGSLSLKSGMEPHPPHKHPEEEILLVTEGSGEISVEGEITKVGAGSMMYTGANRLHGIKNTGKAPLLFYYFKWLKA